MKKPDLTIAIATLGRESLFITLDSIIENKGKFNIEILVIGEFSSESGKRLENYTQKYKFLRWIKKNFESGDLSKKRNIALENSKSEIVAFIDDDVKITKEWIKEGLSTFKKYKNVGIVGGPSINLRGGSLVSEVIGETLSSIAAGISSSRYNLGKGIERDINGNRIIGCNFFVLKKIYNEIGGFNPKMIPGEEIEFANRVIKKGYNVLINPKTYLYHFPRPTIKKFFIQNFRFGYARIRMMRKGVQKFNLIYIAPMAFFLSIAILLILSFVPLFKSVLLDLVAIYIVFLIGLTLYSAIKNKRIESLLIMFIIPIMHFSYALGELKEIIFPERDIKSS